MQDIFYDHCRNVEAGNVIPESDPGYTKLSKLSSDDVAFPSSSSIEVSCNSDSSSREADADLRKGPSWSDLEPEPEEIQPIKMGKGINSEHPEIQPGTQVQVCFDDPQTWYHGTRGEAIAKEETPHLF